MERDGEICMQNGWSEPLLNELESQRSFSETEIGLGGKIPALVVCPRVSQPSRIDTYSDTYSARRKCDCRDDYSDR